MRRKNVILAALLIATVAIAAPTAVKLKLTSTIGGAPVETSVTASFPGDQDKVLTADSAAAAGAAWKTPAASGAPTTSDYLVGTADAGLSAEIVVGTSPGGELGGTWGSPTIDDGLTVNNWVLGTSTATSLNKVAITAPTTSATLTIDDGFTLHATGNVTSLSGAHTGSSSGTNTGDQTSVSGNAGTATALAANGGNCSSGNWPLGVDTLGAVEGCTDDAEAAQDAVGTIVVDTSDLDCTYSDATPSIGCAIVANAVGDADIRQGAATTLVGRSANSTGNVADIAASADGQVLRRAASALGFGAVDLADTDAVTGVLPLVNQASGIVCVRTTSDQTAIGTSFADVTSLSIAVDASATYLFWSEVWEDSDATTTGIDLAVTGPASPTAVVYSQWSWSSTSANVATPATAYDTNSNNLNSNGTTARPYQCNGILVNGSNAGNLKWRTKREAVGTGPNVRSGSIACIFKL